MEEVYVKAEIRIDSLESSMDADVDRDVCRHQCEKRRLQRSLESGHVVPVELDLDLDVRSDLIEREVDD